MPASVQNSVQLGQWASKFQTENLYSGKFYKSVERFNSIEKYDEYCGTATSDLQDSNVRIICAQVLNYLKANSSASFKSNHYDVCKLLNYWVYNRLNEISHTHSGFNITDALNKIESIWRDRVHDKNSVDYYQKCKPDIVLFKYTDWKLRKELFDYYVDISDIISTAKYFTTGCRDYYKYVKYKKSLFDHFETPCSISYNYDCPNFFDACKKYHPDKVLTDFICYQDMKKEEEAQAEVHEEEQEEVHEKPHAIGPLIGAENPNPSTPTAKQAGNALLGVVVTTMTSGALYKFTPLGTILRNKFGWNNSNMNNINGGNNGIYNYASESFNPYSGGEEHYIGYHPA